MPLICIAITTNICYLLLLAFGVTVESKCRIVADIGILVDSSGSLGNEFSKEVQFVKQIAKSLTVSSDGVNIGIVTFSYYAFLTIKLSDYKDTDSFIEGTKKIPFRRSQTYIDRALYLARTSLFTEQNGDRKDVPNIVILLTDGKQTESPLATSPFLQADLLRKNGATVLVIGIGRYVNEIELARIAGKPENFIAASSFDELISGQILNQLLGKACAAAPGKDFSLNLIGFADLCYA